MAPVKLTEINISQSRSDDSKGGRGDVCWSLYFHKPTHTHSDASVWFSAWIDRWSDWQGVGMIKYQAKSNMSQVSGSYGSLQIANFPRRVTKYFFISLLADHVEVILNPLHLHRRCGTHWQNFHQLGFCGPKCISVGYPWHEAPGPQCTHLPIP